MVKYWWCFRCSSGNWMDTIDLQYLKYCIAISKENFVMLSRVLLFNPNLPPILFTVATNKHVIIHIGFYILSSKNIISLYASKTLTFLELKAKLCYFFRI